VDVGSSRLTLSVSASSNRLSLAERSPLPACWWQDVSTHGTYLNRRRLAKKERAVLRPGDSVTFSNMALPSLRLAPEACRASRPALLVQHNAESELELFPLLKPHTAVGRGLAADLRLDQAFISSRQCAIEVRSPAIEVTPAPPLANRGQRSSGAQSSTASAPLPPPSVWLTDESRYAGFVKGSRLTLTLPTDYWPTP